MFSSPSDKARAKKQAENILMDPLIKSPGGFSRLVQNYSGDTASSVRGGELGSMISDPKMPQKYEKWQQKLLDSAKPLKKIGEILPQLVETEKGWHIIKLTGQRPARENTFSQVKEKIVRQLASEAQAREYRDYYERIKSEFDVQLSPEGLESLLAQGKPLKNPLEQVKEEAEGRISSSAVAERQNLSDKPVSWEPSKEDKSAREAQILAIPPEQLKAAQPTSEKSGAMERVNRANQNGNLILNVEKTQEIKTSQPQTGTSGQP